MPPSWPTQSDYKDALQNPDTAFRDVDLQQSAAERSPMGIPRARSGAFASVYKMSGPSGTVALKLFNFPNEDRANRYKAVSDYLDLLDRQKPQSKKPPSIVGFKYHLEGIRVGKGWYPTLTMTWVKGVSLGEWVRQTIEKKVPDVAAMKQMATDWGKLVEQLQEAKIAHGDLQHDNVMVLNNQPVLVDYDGMCVPDLDPADPTKKLDQLEFGKPAYQHPLRSEQKLGCHLDHFAAWVILLAMRAIAADPKLYVKYVLKPDNENLLFTPQDMTAPGSSALWPDLMKCADPEVAGWAKMLRQALEKPFDQIPPFTLDPFSRLRKLVSVPTKDWAAIEAETDRLKKSGKVIPNDLTDKVDPIGGLKELCNATPKDWGAIAAEGDRQFAAGKVIPPELKKVIEAARERVAARDEVKEAVDAGDPRGVIAVYKPALVDDWADRKLVAAARAAAGQVAVLDKLKAAVASPGDGKALVKLWEDSAPKLTGVVEAGDYERAAKQWKSRIFAAETYLRVYAKSPQSERELADAWQTVTVAGPPHPLLLTDVHRKRGEDAVRWAPVLDRLRKVPPEPSYDSDAKLIAAWGDGSALSGCREATEFAARVAAARGRVTLVEALAKAIKQADAGGYDDTIVVTAADELPEGYAHPYATRVAEGAEAIQLLTDLQKAIGANPPSDRKIAAAYDRLKTKNPRFAHRLEKVNAKVFEEAELATRRRAALDEFPKIDKSEPRADKQDEKWLALWKKHKPLLGDREDRKELEKRFTLAANRFKAWRSLSESLDARDIFTLRKLYGEHQKLLGDYPPLLERDGELRALLGKADRVVDIHGKLKAGEELSPEDLAFLRGNHTAFGPGVKTEIERQVRERLAGTDRLSHPGYTNKGGRLIKASWAWGGHGLINHCVVVLNQSGFVDDPDEVDDDEVDEAVKLKCEPNDYQRDGGGMLCTIPPGAAQVFVSIWPEVKLGWTTVRGPRLEVGPVPVARR